MVLAGYCGSEQRPAGGLYACRKAVGSTQGQALQVHASYSFRMRSQPDSVPVTPGARDT